MTSIPSSPTPIPSFFTTSEAGGGSGIAAENQVLSDSVAAASANCNVPPYRNTTEMAEQGSKNVEAALKAVGAQACEYSKSSNLKVAAVGAQGFGMVAAGAGAGFSRSQKAIGCESINVISNIINQTSRRVSCVLSQTSSTLSGTLNVNQTITLKAGDIKGSTIIASTKNEVRVQMKNIQQQEVQNEITNSIEQGVKEAIQQETSQSNEAYSDPNSQKQVVNLCKNLESVSSSTNIQQSVAKTTQEVMINQQIVLDVGNITDSTVNLTIENAVDLVAEQYVYNALSQLLQTTEVQSAVNDIKQTAIQENKGEANPFSFQFSWIWSIIIVVILIGVLGAGGFVISKMKNKIKPA